MKKICVILLVVLCGGIVFVSYHLFKGRGEISMADIRSAEKIMGLEFTKQEKKMMLENLKRNLSSYSQLRNIEIKNHIPPAFLFYPLLQPIAKGDVKKKQIGLVPRSSVNIPENFEDLAFYPVTALSQLIRQRKITCLQLTQLYLDRLKKYGAALECVVTLTEELALKQARRADEEIATGRYRGPLHGIPWGAKDLLSTKGIKTSWGAMPYKDQVIDADATVVKKLTEAGAVLVAKLTLGALAMGDVWFGGKTRNPWNLEQGSSGSSAGSASATAAGLVGFSIGTETLGSIVSPATRCGVTGLRPTFGRVSRYGAMALSWTMDKIGPICRTAEDCALVFDAIYGTDGKDLSVLDYPFEWNPSLDLNKLRIGYLKKAFEKEDENRENDNAVLQIFRSLGAELIPLELPDTPVDAMRFLLIAEAAAAFDELTHSGKDDLLVRQTKGAWPNSFRQARFIPAVEYIQANRLRTILIQKMAEMMKKIDVYIAPSFGNSNLLATNLTGHPAIVVPNGVDEKGSPTSITFIGKLFGEAKLLAAAKIFQDATSFHQKYPDLEHNIQAFKQKDRKEGL